MIWDILWISSLKCYFSTSAESNTILRTTIGNLNIFSILYAFFLRCCCRFLFRSFLSPFSNKILHTLNCMYLCMFSFFRTEFLLLSFFFKKEENWRKKQWNDNTNNRIHRSVIWFYFSFVCVCLCVCIYADRMHSLLNNFEIVYRYSLSLFLPLFLSLSSAQLVVTNFCSVHLVCTYFTFSAKICQHLPYLRHIHICNCAPSIDGRRHRLGDTFINVFFYFSNKFRTSYFTMHFYVFSCCQFLLLTLANLCYVVCPLPLR